jgi:iron(III) transport system ATP-binding protein
MAIVKVEGLVKSFKGVKALDGVSFEFRSGILSFLGPSGCGKTTLLRCIAGLETPDEGRICIEDEVQTSIGEGVLVPSHSRKIGFVFQNYALWPHMSVFANVAFGLRLKKVPSEETRRRVLTTLELVGLKKLEKRYPSQLSGGQQQRVALARSLVMEPRLILLDEPLCNLDAKLREEMRGELKSLIKKVGISALYVTHDQEEAFVLSDTVIVMDRGCIQQYAAAHEIYERPANEFVAAFVGHSSLVNGRLLRREGDRCLVTVPEFGDATLVCRSPERVAAGEPCCLVIRNREVRLSSRKIDDQDNVLEGQIISSDYRAGSTDHRIRVGSKEIVVTSHNLCPMVDLEDEAARVFLRIDKAAISIIPASAAAGREG